MKLEKKYITRVLKAEEKAEITDVTRSNNLLKKGLGVLEKDSS